MATTFNRGNILSKADLLHLIAEAVIESGWHLIYLNNEHPFKVKIYNERESHWVKIIVYNVTHGGGSRRAANEFRIQLKIPRLEQEPPYKTLILGYYRELDVFVGWDMNKHLGDVGYSSSFQIKAENLQTASLTGFSPYNKGNGEIAVAFRSGFLVEYIRTLNMLHSFGENDEDFEVLSQVTEHEIVPNSEIVQAVSEPRQRTLSQIIRTRRDNSFRARVLRAYGYRCAFSGIQLKLVDAAHIVPVSFESSTDETSNGIALSKLHHAAYDRGLITLNEQYQIVYKESEISRLTELNLHGGVAEFLGSLRPVIDAPPALADRPNITYIRTANQLRGWA